MSNKSEQKAFDRFRKWCERTKQEPSSKMLRLWDEKHNRGLLIAGWSQAELLELGKDQVYSTIFNRYSMITVKYEARKIHIAAIRLSRSAGEHRMVDMAMPSLTTKQLENIREKAEKALTTAIIRLKILNLSNQEIADIFHRALNEISEDAA